MICAIILAAGQSLRMGTQKLLLPFAGQTLIGHIVDQVLASPIRQTLVVVSDRAGTVAQSVATRPVSLIVNPDPQGDMLSSIRTGLRALPDECTAVLVVLGDQPGIRPALIGELIQAFQAGHRPIIVPTHQGRRGHPILVSITLREEILTDYEGIGLRGLLDRHSEHLHELPSTDPAVLVDLDFPGDYQKELARMSESRHVGGRLTS